MSKPAVISPRETLPMSVANMTFMVDRLGKDCAPLQFIRELTQNSIESILKHPDKKGEIQWDVDWNRFTLTNTYKLAIIDNGIGMTGEEMLHYINHLSSSMHEQSAHGNFGIGAKIAAAPRNHEGLVYLSWKNGVGSMIHLWRDPSTDEYGLRRFDRPDGTSEYWAYIQDDIKPELIKDHGTMVILLGNRDDENTMQPPSGTSSPSQWIIRYLNTRYAKFPEGITVKVRDGWELPKGDSHNYLRTLTGQVPWIELNSKSSGSVQLNGALAHWFILQGETDQGHGRLIANGHMAALYQDELYELTSGRAGVSRLQAFGIIFGHNRVVIYLEPELKDKRLSANTARTNLLLDGEPLPWADWAAEFRDKLPAEIIQLMEEVASGASGTDHRQSIIDRLKQIMNLFRFSRYRPTRNGSILIDIENPTVGGKPDTTDEKRVRSSDRNPGGSGGRAGDIYSLFLSAKGIPGEELHNFQTPDTKWVTVTNGTRTPPDMEDRAAKYLPQQNLLLINGDFRVFSDMIDYWMTQYQSPGAKSTIEQVVKEWFEQQLVEAIMGSHALRGSPQWTLQDIEKLWSEEALTSVVLPRYHIQYNIKRTLGAKLGTLKDKVIA